MAFIIKRKESEEKFNNKKLYKSCYSACLSAQLEDEKAEKVCKKVSKQARSWAAKKKIITTDDLFQKITLLLEKEDKKAALMYKTHRDIF